MSNDEITAGEIQIIKWGEKILVPVIGSLILLIIIGLFQMRDAVAQLEIKMDADDKREIVEQESDKTMKASVMSMQTKLIELETHLGHLVDDVGEIKGQNQKILDILTGNGHNHPEG